MTTRHANGRALVLSALIAVGAVACASGQTGPATYAGTHQERSATQATSDAALSARIKSSFAMDSLVRARDIKVDVMRGVVTLNGAVTTAAERDKAISIARDTKGVVEVKSNLKLIG